MIEPTQADIGRKVVYRAPRRPEAPEEGVVTSFNEFYVFVRYGNGPTSAATCREDLVWLAPPRPYVHSPS